MRFRKEFWAIVLTVLPWLRGTRAEAFFRYDSAPDEARDRADKRDTARSDSDSESDADAEGFVLHSYVEEVRVSFSVKDREGHPVLGVQPENLQVFENMVRVSQVTSFDRNLETPRRMAVLLDNSSSVEKNFEFLRSTLVDVLSGAMRPGRDEASIASFGGRELRWLTPFTGDVDAIRSGVQSVRAVGVSNLYDGIVEIAGSDRWRAPGMIRAQQVILLFTDGEDNLSVNTLRDAIKATTTSQFYVYAVVVHPKHGGGEGINVLKEITGATGGRVFKINDARDLQLALATISQDMKAQYSIAYRAPTSNRGQGYRQISIIPSDNNWVIRSRAGYIAVPRRK